MTRRPARQVMRVLVDKATGRPRQAVSAKQVVAAVREKLRVELPLESMALPAPLAALGEHAVPLRFDPALVKGQHALTVHLKKRL